MDRWIAGRLGHDGAESRAPGTSDIALMARAAAGLYAAGATLALVWLALPHPRNSNDPMLVLTLACAYAGALYFWVRGDRHSRTWFEAAVAAGSVLISAAIYFSGRAGTPFVLFYLWSNVYAWYFFPWRRAAFQLAFLGAAYATVLAVHDPVATVGGNTRGLLPVLGPGAARWLITLGTMLVAGGLVAILRDRVDRLLGRVTEERNFVSSVLETAAAIVIIFDLEAKLQGFNRAFEAIGGYTVEELRGRGFGDTMLLPEERDSARRAWETVLETGACQFDSHLLTRDGERRMIAWSTVTGRDAHGTVDHVIATGIDITARRRSEDELQNRAAREAAAAELGRRGLEGLPLPQLTDQAVDVVAEHLKLDHCQLWELMPHSGELVLMAARGALEREVGKYTIPADAGSQANYTLTADGPVIVEDVRTETRFTPHPRMMEEGIVSGLNVAIPGPRHPYGVISGNMGRARDFTEDEALFLQSVAHVLAAAIERWRSEQSMRHNALHDPLTGLPNRELFFDRLTHALAKRDTADSTAAVMFMDIDNFKLVNDSLGHDTGDRLLKAVGPRLAGALRPSDTVARFGGDEFVVLCEDVGDGRDAMVVADRLQHALGEPFVLGGEEHFLSASIGVALASGRYSGAEELMRDADAAMYRAKERGRAQCELFDDAMRNRVLGRLRMENAMRGMIDRDEISVHYQPIVSLQDGSITGLEALMRWNHSGLGPVSPLEFIPIAEDTGLIVRLGAWMLEEVCRQAVRWDEELGVAAPPISVNLSPRQVAHAELVPTVARVLEESRLAPDRLALEITESVLINEAESPWNTLHALKRVGVTLMLDDFGTGYSSLSYLKRFPVDVLKIDRTFVDGLGSEAEDSAIVKAVVSMAQALELGVVAEGVETARQVDCLRELGCDRAQGYFFGRPSEAAALTPVLRPVDRALIEIPGSRSRTSPATSI